MTGPRILLLHEQAEVRAHWKQRLLRAGFPSQEGSSASADLLSSLPDSLSLLICGHCGGDTGCSFKIIRQMREIHPRMPIIFVADHGSEELAVRALRAGVSDYIGGTSRVEELAASVTRLLSRPDHHREESVADGEQDSFEQMVGSSAPMRSFKSCLARIAAADSNVLITGETGTGKELAAQFIHRASARRNKPLVCINCAAIPDSLIESELFGYERGAFTGAMCKTAGQLEQANGGTVFLDEVGEMSPLAQAKMLRVIEGKEISRLGGRSSIRLNVRFVAATNQNLEKLVGEDRFRRDLFFRLNIVALHLPSLRERKEDLPDLFRYYIADMNHRFKRSVAGFADDAYNYLLNYAWPGNIRELRNLVEAIFVNLPPQDVEQIDLPAEFLRRLDTAAGAPASERDLLLSALLCTHWNKSKAAKQLNWSRMTIYRKIAKYRLCA
ncbi:MAG TPA: sigma-54 dependent transcriptional regulator [Candidatus Saccharimonadales bacterium]|jgi:DNA-binding NtrC family response regulator|nr:sigma-54 dependent transcriptional regulator [Candidatus Saccharimonadales bacterium]